MAAIDKKALWVAWTHDAMETYSIPEDTDATDELVDDMVEVATKYADDMLDEFEERFGGGEGRRSRRRKTEPEGED